MARDSTFRVFTLLVIISVSASLPWKRDAASSHFSSLSRDKKSMVVPQLFLQGTCGDNDLPQLADPKATHERVNDAVDVIWSNDVTGDKAKLAVHYASNLVKNRALFFSMAMQLQNESREFESQPGFVYYYVSAASGVFAGPSSLVGSGVFFDKDKHYPNWYRGVHFNHTLPLFGPRALRFETSELHVDDMGSEGSDSYQSPGMSHPSRPAEERRLLMKDKHGDVTEVGFASAPSDVVPGLSYLHNECNPQGNRWELTLTYPVVDILPRYTAYTFLRKPRHVALTSADLDVEALDAEDPARVNGFQASMDCSSSPPPPVADYHTVFQSFYETFSPQSRLALRLAQTLSAFMQSMDTITSTRREQERREQEVLDEWYADLYSHPNMTAFLQSQPPDTTASRIKYEASLSNTVLKAEVLANVLTDSKILSSGIFFEAEHAEGSDDMLSEQRRAFEAYRSGEDTVVADKSLTGLDSELMEQTRAAWSDLDNLENYTYHAGIRSSKDGDGLTDYSVDPIVYRAVSLSQGHWTSAYYKCDGVLDDWVVTYAAPFFAPSAADPSKLVLSGIVTVDIKATAENWNV